MAVAIDGAAALSDVGAIEITATCWIGAIPPTDATHTLGDPDATPAGAPATRVLNRPAPHTGDQRKAHHRLFVTIRGGISCGRCHRSGGLEGVTRVRTLNAHGVTELAGPKGEGGWNRLSAGARNQRPHRASGDSGAERVLPVDPGSRVGGAAHLRGPRLGFVPFSLLGKGFLTGTVDASTSFTDGDVRATIPRFTAENRAANQALVDHVATLAQAKDATPGQVALAWLLGQLPSIVSIPSRRCLSRHEENIDAGRAAPTPVPPDPHHSSCPGQHALKRQAGAPQRTSHVSAGHGRPYVMRLHPTPCTWGNRSSAPAPPEKPTKTAGHSPFSAGSRIATHST
ncbi:aldo/keto reductase [Streptomyces lavenduligriseus]|uniref:Aldo/keto reductase n=1 Tax=Streptomyces lavenduligriseus TaxID=67315 RepID=A0ABT0NKR4_9ACTN|nr:aldo/keto reductase [Streptomyces lavenduligriseus]MCL3992055.1 aldo/keto reductase [Streptomyces lavenduligriseus]